jgi:hypothetical protein
VLRISYAPKVINVTQSKNILNKGL